MGFADRRDAGRKLAAELRRLAGPDLVVVGIPRGGVVVAAEVAAALGAPLDAVVVRKLGVPADPEVAMGAIGEDGVRVLHPDVVRQAAVTDAQLAAVEARERTELDRRARAYRSGRPRVDLTGRTALVVDDGIATGATAEAAGRIVRALGAARVVLAAPVAAAGCADALVAAGAADQVVCLLTPGWFRGVGYWYGDFAQTTDAEVVACLTVRPRERP